MIIQKNPNDAPALNNRGIAMAELGDPEGAMEYYEKAIKADSSYAPAYYNKGVLLDKKLEHDESLKVLDEAIEKDPKKPNPRFYKGIVLGKNTADPARWKRYKGGTAGDAFGDYWSSTVAVRRAAYNCSYNFYKQFLCTSQLHERNYY